MHNSERLIRKLVGMALPAVVATAAVVVAIPTSAVASGGSAADWMYDGRFGVMQHYLAEGCPAGCSLSDYPDNMPTVEEWNDRVNHYDVDGVAQQLKSGAQAGCRSQSARTPATSARRTPPTTMWCRPWRIVRLGCRSGT
ncbi:hypothetical protein [Streptomyces rhizosphaericus]|uniref:hypothetical protein n=1 Tax=Streptomyces rhizosphaericus TaxID=114699 RepID=UPI00364543C9